MMPPEMSSTIKRKPPEYYLALAVICQAVRDRSVKDIGRKWKYRINYNQKDRSDALRFIKSHDFSDLCRVLGVGTDTTKLIIKETSKNKFKIDNAKLAIFDEFLKEPEPACESL